MWDVNFFPVIQRVLESTHKEFFFKLEAWKANKKYVEMPTVPEVYKEFLRTELSFQIAAHHQS